MLNFSTTKEIIKNAFEGFLNHKVLKMSAALAYTTVFSMAPLVLILLFLCDFFWGREALEGLIYGQIKNFTGPTTAKELQQIIQNISLSEENNFTKTLGVITLLVGATSVFAEIQDSINTIWGIRKKKKSGIWIFIKSRLLSFGVIGSLGFIMLVSVSISTVLDFISEPILKNYSEFSFLLIYLLNAIVSLLITTFLFACIFKILPDAKISWKQVRFASITTAILFMLGKFLISFYITKSDIGSTYGAAGSIVILMIWVYYSAMILYLGAELAKAYATTTTIQIVPSSFAELID